MSRNVEDVYELTPLQHGMLFQTVTAPDSGVYVEQAYLTLVGGLDHDAFWVSWQSLFDRHPALRSTFHWEQADKPLQVVHRSVRISRDEIDLRDQSESQQHRRLEDFVETERANGLDLENPPLLRITLFRLADRRYRVVLRISHLVVDGWSVGVLLDEFIKSYRARYHGNRPVLAESGHYRDYVAWWKNRDPTEVERFWRDYFADAAPPAPVEVGTVIEPPADGVSHGRVDLSLSDIADRLRTFARTNQLTLHTLMQGAWMAVLARCTGAEEVVAGTTMAHRPPDVPGVANTVGPMLVTVPVRAEVRAEQPALEWLRGVQETVVAVRDHAAAPLTDIRRWAGVSRSTDLFETIVSFENVPLPALEFPDEDLELEDYFFDGRPQYAFGFVVLPGEDMPLRLVHDRRRFTEQDARLMLLRVREFLVSLVDDPAQAVGAVPMLPAQERRLLGELQQRSSAEPVDRTLPHVVAEHARRQPERIAVSDGSRSVTYRQLVTHADRLARYLYDSGVRPGDHVALHADRSVTAIVGMLAVLTSGAAYVPLDPGTPTRRLTFILRDCAPAAVLTETGLADDVQLDGVPVLLMDDEVAETTNAQTAPEVSTSGQDTAYLIYTSGSTGSPKGVRTTHENVLRLMSCADDDLLSVDPEDVWTSTHSFAFDVSVWEIWGALWHGSELVVVPHEQARDPHAMLEIFAARRVSVIMLTPKEFEQVIAAEAVADDELRSTLALRVLVLGGDRVDPSALRPWFERRGVQNPRILNCYGPTEATCFCISHEITRQETLDHRAASVIGHPVTDTSVYLLDEQVRPTPFGAVGEICVAGPGISSGYHGKPELTREKFVPEPSGTASDEARTTMYHTGDLARYDAAGRLVYLGRRDQQVKIRGFRVELGEIAAALREQTGVTDAAAALRAGPSGDERLVAYVTGDSVDTESLPARLRTLLPAYMVPAGVLAVDGIPLTASGKLDLKALPNPASAPAGVVGYRGPSTETEHELASIMSELLGVPYIAVDANLVDLGMHSLLATTVVSRIRESWQIPMPLRTLFETPTVEALARAIEGGDVFDGRRPGEIDLATEGELSEDIHPLLPDSQEPRTDGAEHVLLTGGTGFLGGALLHRLLQTTDSIVHCLVRADDTETGRRRLCGDVAALGDWHSDYNRRVIPVPGSLAKSRLGMSEQDFADLAESIDRIYHCGAAVNFVHPYHRLRSSNVAGTIEILRLACSGRAKPLSYVSSGTVVGSRSSEQPRTPVQEAPLDSLPPRLSSGYAQSKWVAEQLVSQVGERGLPVVIHRAGRIVGNSRTGAWQGGDATAEMLRASSRLGAVPELDEPIDLTPIDFVVDALLELAPQSTQDNAVYHLSNPVPTSVELIRSGFEQFGTPVSTLSMADWYAELVRASRNSPGSDLDAVVALFGQWVHDYRQGMRDPVFDTERAGAALPESLRCPPVDSELIARYLSSLHDSGYFSVPDTKRDEVITQR